MNLVNKELLIQHSRLVGTVGTITLVFGALAAIAGLFAFLIGAIPGIINIILGLKLREAKRYADQLLASDRDPAYLNRLFGSLNSYFKVTGILLIINIAIFVLGFLSMVIFGSAAMNMMQ